MKTKQFYNMLEQQDVYEDFFSEFKQQHPEYSANQQDSEGEFYTHETGFESFLSSTYGDLQEADYLEHALSQDFELTDNPEKWLNILMCHHDILALQEALNETV